MLIYVEHQLLDVKEIFNEIRGDLTADEITEIEVTIQILSDTIKSSKNGDEFDNACKTKLEIMQRKQIFEEILPSIIERIIKREEKAKSMAKLLRFLMGGTAGWFWG